MAFFFFALLAGFAWMGLRGDVGLVAYGVGCALGALVWRIEGIRSSQPFGAIRALRLACGGMRVAGLFLVELFVANWRQLRIVLAPRIRVRPHWYSFETELESPALRALLGVMICLTPGSLTCEEIVEDDGRVRVFVHSLDTADPEADIARIRARLEAPLRALEQT